MNQKIIALSTAVVVVFLLLISSSLFIVNQTQQALILQFGEIKNVHKDPGLKFKMPFVQDVIMYEKRLLDYELSAVEITARDQKRVVIDAFARFLIGDPLTFYRKVGSEANAQNRLASLMTSALRSVIGNVPLAKIISEERSAIMKEILTMVNKSAKSLGIDVIDVRIRRADLPRENSEAIFNRMKSEREREAKAFRAEGAKLAQETKSKAEKERSIILAQAQQKSQELRGHGDGESIRIQAAAYNKDPEFFSFYRSLEAYRESLATEGTDTTLLLSPNSDFLKHFK